MIRRLAALAAAALVVVPLVTSGAAVGRADDPHGSAGIGDPYFPLDGNGGIDVRRYEIHDRYDFGSRKLSGWTKVSLTVTEDLSGFDLDFLLPVRSVTIDGDPVDFHQDAHELVIEHATLAGGSLDVVVRYAGKPSAYSYEGESNWLASDQEVVAMNQPHMAPWWFPSNDHPLDKASMSISITVPKANQVVANGTRDQRTVHGDLATTTWTAAPMVPYLAFFAAGRYTVAKSNEYGIPSYVAVSKALKPAEQRTAMGLMKQTPKLLDWLTKQLGDYPFATTGGLTTSLGVGFALENQTRPTYPYMGDGSGAVSTVVHELAHQWFGDSVALAGWKDIWLNEGFATFMEDYYAETHGGPGANARLHDAYDSRDADDAFWNLEVADPCPSHTRCVDRIFDGRVYQRGALALQALRNVIGETDFWDVLRTWATTRRGGNGSTEQFQAVAEEKSGQDLDGFFDAWLHAASKPADTAANGLG
ncbi:MULTISPECIES: M1 family metallopeptidase [unclassified Nocardioides]|uniref:M1 family metallopeptidase n=1 Tax=unclassified Nocardioides TaxID=2615069 RepID=UPI0009EFD2FF|nr:MULTISPECIES: M1 family metallopeptidase [unclassified Nocardioides]GAW48599.1 peptidase M1, membrane alanine aminopeptidase [Nocardioides sp. PD653-B2]GAW54302.1 peptidase M1, membrane alanine aminopeptidase [Nocardioides sp. PD653]